MFSEKSRTSACSFFCSSLNVKSIAIYSFPPFPSPSLVELELPFPRANIIYYLDRRSRQDLIVPSERMVHPLEGSCSACSGSRRIVHTDFREFIFGNCLKNSFRSSGLSKSG